MYNKIFVFCLIAFSLGLVLYLNFSNNKKEKFSNMMLKEILINRNMKYTDDNLRLSSLAQINKDNLKILNNKLFNSDLKIIKQNTRVKNAKAMILLKSFGDVFKNTDNSLMEIVELREKMLSIINSFYDKLNGKVACNLKDFLKYCKNGKVVTKKEGFSNVDKSIRDLQIESYYAKKGKLIEKVGDDKIVTDFRNISMKDSLSSFKNTKNSILLDLIKTFEEREGKEYNVFNKDDLVKLVLIFIDDLKKILTEIKTLIV